MSLTNLSAPEFTDAELAELSTQFESWSASSIIEWAVENFAPHLALTASMTDSVLIDLAVKVDPAIEVVFIDTGYHFPETLETVEEVRRRYGLNLRMMTVRPPGRAAVAGRPGELLLGGQGRPARPGPAGKAAWMSGLRRAEADSRVTAPIVARDLRGLMKVNPIATWSDLDVQGYIAHHDILVNPLIDQGYPSIGCWPCTRSPPTPTIPARAAGPAGPRRSAGCT